VIPPGAILLADDDAIYRVRLARAFERHGFTPHEAHDGRSALEVASTQELDYAVLDLRMPPPDGLEVLAQLKSTQPEVNAVVLTGYGSIATAIEPVRLGATYFVPKPADVRDLMRAFARAHESAPEIPQQTPSLARAEWEHIQRVLVDCGGNISRAAKVLRIQRRTLQRKLAKHPVPR
jgi:two-component system response regulator RegA